MLGDLSKRAGDQAGALQYFRAAAADTQSLAGKNSYRELALVELPNAPGQYLNVRPMVFPGGSIGLEIRNPSPLDVRNVSARIRYIDGAGQRREIVHVAAETIAANSADIIVTPIAGIPANQLRNRLAVKLEKAEIAN